MIVKCDYCSRDTELVSGIKIYPHRRDLYGLMFYRCLPCKAYVGCHKGTDKPLGRLANKTLRGAKTRAHAAFDPLWKSGRMSRKEAYKWLAEQMGISEDNCHIGMFDVDACESVVLICKTP